MTRLAPELMCSVCLCTLTEAVAAKACMHRFCQECIASSLRLGRKSCPACRAPCASRRNLAPDGRFQQLIDLLSPDAAAQEQQVIDHVAAFLQSDKHRAFVDNAKRLEQRHLDLRSKRRSETDATRKRESIPVMVYATVPNAYHTKLYLVVDPVTSMGELAAYITTAFDVEATLRVFAAEPHPERGLDPGAELTSPGMLVQTVAERGRYRGRLVLFVSLQEGQWSDAMRQYRVMALADPLPEVAAPPPPPAPAVPFPYNPDDAMHYSPLGEVKHRLQNPFSAQAGPIPHNLRHPHVSIPFCDAQTNS